MTCPKTMVKDGKTYFTNLPALVSGNFKPVEWPGAGWISFEYELDIFPGIGLATAIHSPAAELTMDLGLKGRHRLRVAHNPAIRIRMDGHPGYIELPGDASTIREAVMPEADFTGRRIHISPARGTNHNQELTLFYLAAEPCDAPYASHKNLIVTNDGHGVFCRGIDNANDLYRHILPYCDSDVFRIVWGLYGGAMLTMNPNTRVGVSPIRPEDGSFYERDLVFNQSLRSFQEAGTDPLAVVRKATRELGFELHYYIRLGAFYGPFPRQIWTTQFFKDHPEWRCRDEFGRTLNLMSYAFPQVQDHVLAFYSELLDYEPDGICLAFNRGLYLAAYEEPVLEAYRRKHGRAPKLPEECNSPELLAVRHELLAEFVARVTRLVESKGKSLSCIVPRDFDRNRLFGLDASLLVKRGLVHSMMVGAGHVDPPALNAELEPVKALKAAAAGTRIYSGGSHVCAHGCAWAPRDLAARAKHMTAILDAGLDGGWFWDAEHLIGYEWEAMRRFGDRATLERISAGKWPENTNRETLRLHDLTVTRYNPWHAY